MDSLFFALETVYILKEVRKVNNRHRLVRKLEQRRFMNDVKKISKCVPSPTFAALCGTYNKGKIFMASYLAVQEAFEKFRRRVIIEFSE